MRKITAISTLTGAYMLMFGIIARFGDMLTQNCEYRCFIYFITGMLCTYAINYRIKKHAQKNTPQS